MNTPIHDPRVFIKLFCAATKIKVFDPTDRACAITRSNACYGDVNSVIIEWEGSPARFTIFYTYGGIPVVFGKQVKDRYWMQAVGVIQSFLAAHPANEDGSSVWVGTRYKDRP